MTRPRNDPLETARISLLLQQSLGLGKNPDLEVFDLLAIGSWPHWSVSKLTQKLTTLVVHVPFGSQPTVGIDRYQRVKSNR